MPEELDTDRDAEETDDEGEDIMEVSVHDEATKYSTFACNPKLFLSCYLCE